MQNMMTMQFQEIPLQVQSNYAPEGIYNDETQFVIREDWNALVAPVEGVREFDFSRPVPSVDVCRINGELVIIDGRKRVLAAQGRYRLGYRVHDFSPRRAKHEFLQRHFLVG
jgi:hypothetical protein